MEIKKAEIKDLDVVVKMKMEMFIEVGSISLLQDNAEKKIYEKYKELFDTYNVKDKKRQHDMLACHEGLAFLNNSTKYCKYEVIKPFNTGLKGTYTQWGSTKTRETPYREVLAAIEYETK